MSERRLRPDRWRWVFGGLFVGMTFFGVPVWAQRGVAVEATVSGNLVPGAVTRDNVAAATAVGESSSEAVLFHEKAAPSATLSVRLALGSAELVYRADLLSLGSAVVTCRGDAAPVLLDDGRWDDAAVNYSCGLRERRTLAERLTRTMVVHTLGGGLRLNSVRRGGSIIGLDAGDGVTRTVWFATFDGGLAMTTYTWQLQDRRIRPGVYVAARGGIELPVSREVSLTLSTGYRFILLSAASPARDGASRSVAQGQWVGTSLFDGISVVGLEAGLRVGFR